MRTHFHTRLLSFSHALYLLFGGGWPLLHLKSFEAVTGPKHDEFLVRTVALLLILVGSILLGQRKAVVESSAVQLAMGTSFILGTVAIVSAAGGWVWKVYFIDGTIHLLFVLAWAFLLFRGAVSLYPRTVVR